MSILINSITAIGYYWHDRWVYRLASLSLLDNTNFFEMNASFSVVFRHFILFAVFTHDCLKRILRRKISISYSPVALYCEEANEKITMVQYFASNPFSSKSSIVILTENTFEKFLNNICKICIRHVIISNHVCKW